MSLRIHPSAVVLVLVLSSCGRIGYDQTADLAGRSTREGDSSGGVSSGPDSGGIRDGGANSTGSGGASGGNAAAGGTDSGRSMGGGSGASDASSGGAADAALNSGGAVGTGGAIGNDGSAGSGGTVGNDGSAGAGGSVAGDGGIVGCADGEREGFLDLATYPDIAACSGGFALPGVVGLSAPACGRTAGDDGARPDGTGCNALDLCAAGFHICSSAAELALKSSTACAGAAPGAALEFFVTAQSGLGARKCDPTGIDDLFGCGTLGTRPANTSNCTPLDRWSSDLCGALAAPWACGSDATAEAANVVKPGSAAGGVLCCRD